MDFIFKDKYDVNDLKKIMQLLRSENGCPWDKEQTHQSIRNNFIEETYEVIEAIDKNDPVMLKEELGDVLLQIIFHSQIASENSFFNFDEVVSDICLKLIVRHPHIFSDVKVRGTAEVLENWNAIKNEQKGHTTFSETLMAVPMQLPALMRAQKVQGRAKKAGFCYATVLEALDDLKSEIAELEQAIILSDRANINEEIGDVIFSSVNISRLLGCESEEMLTESTNKFIKRFSFVEKIALENNIILSDSDIGTLNCLWGQAKKACIQED